MSALQWLADSSNQATGGACLALNPWLVRLDAGIGAAAALGLLTAIQFLIDTRAALLHRKTALVIVAVLSGCVALRLAAVLALSSQAHPAEEAAIIATALLFIASAIAFRTLVPFLAPQSRRTAKLELSAFNPPTARQVSQHDPGACLQARNSELEAASDKLARSEVRFRRLIEAGLGATIMINPAGMIERVNAEAERMFGWARQELLGAALEIVIPAQRHQAHAEWCAAFCRSPHERPAAVLIRLSAIKKSGADFPVEVRLTPIETEDGVKILASISDLSASVMAAAELENDRARVQAASHAKSSYLASVSHDLRTPLNGILGYAQLLRMEAKLPARQTEYVEAMVEAGHHLLATINNVLDLNEIESQHLALRPATFALRPALTECVSLIQPAAAAKGLTVRLEIAEDTPAGVLGDRVRLQQILINLLGNAAKFTSAGSITMRVTACPRRQDDMFRFAVADTGPGIPTNQAERVFERFERLDTHVADAVEGSGLGLTLSSQVAALMGGSLRYEDNPGGGSLFLLEIPLGVSALPAGQKPATRLLRHDNKRHASARILVVDDTAMNRDVACRFLAASGYDPIVAVGGEDAVRVAKDEDLAAILMDVVMPEVDGIEATSRIRALAGPRGTVPIIGLTANAFVQQVQTCLQAGMDDHLAKPYHFPDLLAKIRRAVDLGAHRRRELSCADAALRSGDCQRPLPQSAASLVTGHAAAALTAAERSTAAPAPPEPPTAACATAASARTAFIPTEPGAVAMDMPMPGFASRWLPLAGLHASVGNDPLSALSPLVFDQTVFDATAVFLAPGAVARHVQKIARNAEVLLAQLLGEAEPAGTPGLRTAVHSLAGSAGQFGFRRLHLASIDFERATLGEGDLPRAKAGLLIAVQASLTALRAGVAGQTAPVAKALESLPA